MSTGEKGSRGGPTGVVFRDATARTTLDALARRAESAVVDWRRHAPDRARALEALLALGDYETALADQGDQRELLALVADVTDALAEVVVADAASSEALGKLALAERGSLRQGLLDRPARCKRPEGFAYYAIRPEAVARGLPPIAGADPVVVVGIRTIGTTLSAIAAAALRSRAVAVRRVTVRPGGDSYDKRVSIKSSIDKMAEAAVRRAIGPHSQFVVIDEGPGLSGSTFLAVAAWLESLGVPTEQILLLGSHVPEPAALCAPGAATRWTRYRSTAFVNLPVPGTDLAGGQWRTIMGLPSDSWPSRGSLTDREKVLHMGADGSPVVEKFEGLGGYGRACVRRIEAVAAAGFGPRVLAVDHTRGAVTTPYLPALRPHPDGFRAWAPRLVHYCAFRARTEAFSPGDDGEAPSALEEAAIYNAEQELGSARNLRGLPVLRPIVTDGHMQPWEWLATPEGELFKTDASSHGDDHLLPGPTDIAWDLAGVVVEWRLGESDRTAFLDAYAGATGDADLGRVASYEVAYCACRAAALGMTNLSVGDEEERQRLTRERDRLRDCGRRALARLG